MCIGRKVCLLLNVASVRLPNNVRRHLYLFTSFNVTFSADDVVPPQAQNLRTRHILFPFVCSELGNKTTIVYLSHAYIIFFHVLTWVILFLCNSQTITTRCCEWPDALLPSVLGLGQQCIGSSTAPRGDSFDCCTERYELLHADFSQSYHKCWRFFFRRRFYLGKFFSRLFGFRCDIM